MIASVGSTMVGLAISSVRTSPGACMTTARIGSPQVLVCCCVSTTPCGAAERESLSVPPTGGGAVAALWSRDFHGTGYLAREGVPVGGGTERDSLGYVVRRTVECVDNKV